MYRTQKKWLLVFLVFFLSGSTACSLSATPEPTSLPPGWLSEWLHNPVCQPPCWQGIVPGETTITETEKIFNEIPWISYNTGYIPINKVGLLQLDWIAGHTGGYATGDRTKNVTLSIGVGGSLFLKLSEIVNVYGFPSDVIALDCHGGFCHIELIYLPSGMVLYINPKPDSKGFVAISPDIKVEEILFFPAGKEGFLLAFPLYSESFSDLAVPWDGYSKYQIQIKR